MKKSIFLAAVVFITAAACAQTGTDKIRLNQLGFYPGASKIAVVATENNGDFQVKDIKTGQVVFKGSLSEQSRSPYSKKVSRVADFSGLQTSGSFIIEVPGTGISYPFEIKPGIHREVTKGLIKGFYYQRMSTALLPVHAGKWSRKAGHPDTRVLIHPSAISPGRLEESVISSPKGWYDAGDYNKYIVNSGITMGTLLSLYEDFPDYFQTLELNIPESANGVPDLLDEILWNLRWMLTMQDPYDGGVYHKVTNPSFDGMVMPHEAVEPRYALQKGTAATLDFAAVMAQASRIFRDYGSKFPGLADSCSTAARAAWKWALENPALAYNQNAINKMFTPVISTGAYGDNNFTDEFIWAAAELYISTGDKDFYDQVDFLPDTLMPLPSWNNVRLLGYYTLARHSGKLKAQARKDFRIIKQRLVSAADRLVTNAGKQPYRTPMGTSARDFVWGSNSVAANQGILLIYAGKLTRKKHYQAHALANLDYILGRNATGYSFVTGFGSKTPMNIHHRQSEADGIKEPVPGLIAGGPNPGRQDKCDYPFLAADESYVDASCSYASNEIAINWNAPAAYLAGAIDALFSK
jgi:endoglucanase